MKEPSYRATLAALCVMLPVHLFLPIIRFYLLRHRRRTTAFIVSDVLMLLFVLEGLASAGMIAYQVATENKAADKYEGLMLLLYMLGDQKNGKLYYTEATAFNILLWTIKGAFLALYCGLTQRLSRWIRWALYATIFYTVASFIACMGLYLGFCQPIAENWTPRMSSEACIPASINISIINFQFIANLSTHILITLFPLAIFRSYNLAKKEKVGLIFIFSLAVVSIGMTCLRYGIMRNLLHQVLEGRANVMLAYVRYQQLLAVAELLSINIAFCLPSFRGLVARLRRPNWNLGSMTRSRQEESIPATVSQKGGWEIAITRDFDVRVSSYSNEVSALSALGLLGLDSEYRAAAYRAGAARRPTFRNGDYPEPKLLAHPEEAYVMDSL